MLFPSRPSHFTHSPLDSPFPSIPLPQLKESQEIDQPRKVVGEVLMELYGAEEKQPCRMSSKKRSGGGKGSAMGARGDGDGDGSGKSGRPSFSGRCARLVKEQRARFYIMRRCVTMLVCWREYA